MLTCQRQSNAAVAAGLATATVTKPIWLVKTRLQLDIAQASKGTSLRQYSGSMDCVRQVLKAEGVTGLYRGLTASYLGTAEAVIHLVLYERLKLLFSRSLVDSKNSAVLKLNENVQWISVTGVAGLAKVAAVLMTYPHEVTCLGASGCYIS